jgi:isochorismate synthase
MQAKHFLNEELQKISTIITQNYSDHSDVSFHFQYENFNIYELLNHLIGEKIFYFKSKYNDFSFLGLGLSKIVKARDLQPFLDKYPKYFLVASFLFEQDPKASEFYLPEWIFINQAGKTELSVHKSLESKSFSSPQSFFNPFKDFDFLKRTLPKWKSYNESPERDHWSEMIESCHQLFKQEVLEKIVLSRQKIFTFDETIGPLSFFLEVMERNNFANSSYAIFYQTQLHESFISLTPEKLFSLKGHLFESISLAASAPRGATIEEDQYFEELLLTSEKLKREHRLVTEDIQRKITPFAESVSISPFQTMKLPYIQHRSHPLEARLLPHIGPMQLVSLLHPTPAVGGLPSLKSLEKIRELEPYERKKYAAPIGVLSKHFSELAVGIRSADLFDKTLILYGGAGIVKGSKAEEEWLETETKMNPFLRVVNHE